MKKTIFVAVLVLAMVQGVVGMMAADTASAAITDRHAQIEELTK